LACDHESESIFAKLAGKSRIAEQQVGFVLLRGGGRDPAGTALLSLT
jgi:hypothetical protein